MFLCEYLPIALPTQANIGALLGIFFILMFFVSGGFRFGGSEWFLGPFELSWIWACTAYANSKGFESWFGLLGIASFLGLLILVLLPDHTGTE